VCAISGIIIGAVFEHYNNYKSAIASLIVGFVLTIFGWTICWMYDSPQEFLARLKYDNVRTFYITEDSVEKFNIDLKNSNIVYVNTINICKEHGDSRCKCNAKCEYVQALYIIIHEDKNNKTQYEMLVEKEGN